MLYGAFSCCALKAKIQLFQTITKGNQPRAKVQAEIVITIAQELPLKKQPHNGTNNFMATKYSS